MFSCHIEILLDDNKLNHEKFLKFVKNSLRKVEKYKISKMSANN
jgi:hypothetical protein